MEGGEYNFGSFALTNLGAVYDPLKQTWTPVKPPKGWQNIGDSPSVVLADGTILPWRQVAQAWCVPRSLHHEVDRRRLDAGKNDFNAEEGWTFDAWTAPF